MEQKRLPIGYYLKLADNCLTKGIDDILSQHGLSRTEWQVLHAIYEQPEISAGEMLELMTPIADNRVIEAIITKFIDKSQVKSENNMLTLTEEGKKLHTVCFHTQQEFRKKAVAGIPDADYLVTLSTLKKMIANIA